MLHAFPATTNAPSNALCRKHGFALHGPIDYTYRERTLRVNHWVRDTLPHEALGLMPGAGRCEAPR